MISVVVPVYNEAESLRQLSAELSSVAAEQGWEYELLFVDDGSTDESWRVIRELAQEQHPVGGLRLRRNCGKAAALQAGFDAARGDLVATLDADLQDDPRELPRFVAALDDGQDVVSGWKQVRHDPWDKVWPSRVFNWLVSRLSGVSLHDHNCGFKMYRREVVADLRLYGEMHRFVPVLAAARGWRIGEIVVQHRPRRYGRSKYGFSRNIKGFLDLATVLFLTRFGERPQHFLGCLGLAASVLGTGGMLLAMVAQIGRQLWPYSAVIGNLVPPAIYGALTLAVGVLLLALGLVAELIVSAPTGPRRSLPVCEQLPVAPPPSSPVPAPTAEGGAG